MAGRVLQVFDNFGYGGAELVVSKISHLLVKRGVETDFLILGKLDEQLRDQLFDHRIRVHCLGGSRRFPFAGFKLIWFLRKQHYDVVHAHLFPSLYYCAFASLFFPNRFHWIYTEHSTTNRRRAMSVLKFFEALVYRRFHRVTAISDAVANELVKWMPGVNPKIRITYNGIDREELNSADCWLRNEMGLLDEDKMIVVVGAFRKEKNQQVVVRALELLPERFNVMFAGEGPTRLKVERLSQELGLSKRVRFLGNVQQIGGLLKSADYYIQPSLFEGFGIAALEAAAMGLPVVYADVPGLSDIFEGAGWPVDPIDPENIARTILDIESNCECRERRVSRAIIRSGEFDLEAAVSNYLDMYEEFGVSSG